MILIHVCFEFVVKEPDSKNNLQHVLVNAFATKSTYGWGEGRVFFLIEYSLYKHQILHPKKHVPNKTRPKVLQVGLFNSPQIHKNVSSATFFEGPLT